MTWHRLLATGQALFGGASFENLRMPAYGGSLFDPARFPFLIATTAGGLLAEMSVGSASPGPDALGVGREVTSLLLLTYAMRMAAALTMSTAAISLRTGAGSAWWGSPGPRYCSSESA